MAGGKREGAGRKPGVPNKITKDVKALAQVHGPAAIETLGRLAREADSDAARIAACRELLDRAYGKASQHMTGDFRALIQVLSGVPRAGDH